MPTTQTKNEWRRVRLGDYLEKIVGGGTPSKSKPEYWDGDILWVSVKDMQDGKYTLETTQDSVGDLYVLNDLDQNRVELS
jgi:type I restriction enzyme, S subunit